MTVLRPRAVNVTQFTWVPEQRMYVAEISDFGPRFNFGRVYDDACDEGLTLVDRFGTKEIVFAVEDTVVRDGDLLYWDLKAVKPSLVDFTIRIFND